MVRTEQRGVPEMFTGIAQCCRKVATCTDALPLLIAQYRAPLFGKTKLESTNRFAVPDTGES
jgi:hypothetical protein